MPASSRSTTRCVENAQGIHDALPEPAEKSPAEADPAAMVEAARTSDMAVVRKQLKAGVAVDADGGRE